MKMSVNYMSEVVKMLGLEVGQQFTIGDDIRRTFWFTETTLMSINENLDEEASNYDVLGMILNGAVSIHKLPPKPQIDERYYIPCLSVGELCSSFIWANDEFDMLYYRRGLVCITAEEAENLTRNLLVQIKELRNNE